MQTMTPVVPGALPGAGRGGTVTRYRPAEPATRIENVRPDDDPFSSPRNGWTLARAPPRGVKEEGTERLGRLAGSPSTAADPPRTERQLPPCPPMPDGRVPVVAGYTLLRLLGAGSFGQVYQAREEATGKTVAIKFFTSGAGDRWQTLLEEVRLHAQLDAVGGIVDLKQVVSAADPPYYIMAFADGGSLEDRLAAGTVAPAEVLPLFRRVARALAYVHAKGICHCDLKPGNILLDARGQPLLADFGQSVPSSSSAAALGTLFYMSPQQADTRNTLPDPCWDVYALGAVVFTLLTGQRPRFSPDVQAELHLISNLDARLAPIASGCTRHRCRSRTARCEAWTPVWRTSSTAASTSIRGGTSATPATFSRRWRASRNSAAGPCSSSGWPSPLSSSCSARSPRRATRPRPSTRSNRT